MQRQSLGSPGSRHVLAADADEDRRRSGRWSRGGGGGGGGAAAAIGYDLVEASAARDAIVEEDNEEERKKPQLPRPPPSPEMTVHLIPVLTLFCFLVLFLISHDPSAKDLGEFRGSTALLHTRDMDAASAAGLRSFAVGGAESTMSGVSAGATQGHRRLKELEKEKLRGVGVVRSRKLGVGSGAGFEERLRQHAS